MYLFGAHISSFIVDGKELIFLSKKAVFDGVKAIRGGIPLCWPQFGPGDLPQHGFARTSHWTLHSSHEEGQCVSATLQLSHANYGPWNGNSFTVQLVVALTGDKRLETTFRVRNDNQSEPFVFQFAFHSYFSVPDIRNVRIQGLKGCTYVDKTRQMQESVERDEHVSITEETDRMYRNTPSKIVVLTEGEVQTPGIVVVVEKSNSLGDSVVWNVWSEKIKSVADLQADDYLHYVCVESGSIAAPVSLSAGQEWVGKQSICNWL